jgi:very-short-patch-repair endonuclease
MPSSLEARFAWQLTIAGLPTPEVEYRFAHPRRWRFDFAWPDRKVAAEVEGGVWSQGRHTRGAGYSKDCEKYNSAMARGWQVYRFTAEMIDDGSALDTITKALNCNTEETS